MSAAAYAAGSVMRRSSVPRSIALTIANPTRGTGSTQKSGMRSSAFFTRRLEPVQAADESHLDSQVTKGYGPSPSPSWRPVR